jgi:uncharacterized protein YkwD/N-acetylneuraminic acid mutarotase
MSLSRPSRRRPRRLSVEELERRDLLAGAAPTALEQQMLEQLNDARSNPAAYGQQIGVDLSGIAPSQPLAFNPLLIGIARQHAQDMNVRAYFAHDTPEGVTPDERIRSTGLVPTVDAESLSAGYATTADSLAGLIQDQGVPDLGHRRQLLAIDDFLKPIDQLGIGIVLNGTGPYRDYYTLDGLSDGGTAPFLTGVVYDDANGNGHYDPGEGLTGATIAVAGVGAFPVWDTGGYSIRLNPGTYSVTASGGRLANPITTTVTVGPTNYRLNFIGQSTLSWTTLPDLPTAQSRLAAAALSDGRVFAVGGQDTTRILDTVEVYTPGSNRWAAGPALPTARIGLAAVTGNDGKIYAIGGSNGVVTGEVDVYDPGMNLWTPLATDPMPTPRERMEAALAPDGKIYVFGGLDVNGNPATTAEVFDPSALPGQRWSSLPALPVSRADGGAALGPDGKIYVVGGEGGGSRIEQPLAEVDVFTPGSSTPWTQAAGLPDPRLTAAAVAAGADGRIYLVGGTTTDGQQAPVDAYQVSTGTWGVVTNLPVGRTDLAAVTASDGQLYAVGGDVQNPSNGANTPSPAAEALSTSGALGPVSTVTLLSYAGPPLPPDVTPGGPTGPGSGSGPGGVAPVQFTTVTDVTRLVAVTLQPPRRHKGGWQQVVTVGDAPSGSSLTGPLMLVLDHLDKGSKLRGRAGRTRRHAPLKSPYLVVGLGAGGVLVSGEGLAVVLQFSGARPHYSARVLAGPGTV